MSNEFHIMTSVTSFYTIDANSISISSVTRLTAIEVMHWEGCVRRYLVKTLSISYSFFNRILIIENFVT